MAAWYFLIYFLAIPSCLVSGQSPTFGLKGGKVFLKPDITGHPDGIRWKFKGNTVVEFEAQVQQVFRPYQNRITLNWVTAELNIADLRLEDSGDYELEVEINNALHTSYYALEVMDKVSRPTISCKMNDGGSLNVSGELVCSAEPQPSLKFEWGARGNVQLGPQLQIPLGDEHDDEVYSCSVSNQLSKETTTFTAKDCYPEGSSSAVPITIAVIIVLVLLLGCVAIHCFKRHNKACFAEEDDLEKQSLSGCKENEMTKQEEIPNKGLVERVKKRLGLEGSNKREGQNDEKRSLVHRESTLPSKQKLFQGNKYRRTNTFPDKQNEATDLDHKEPVKEAEAQSTPRVEAPPAAQALSPLTKSSLNTAPKDPAGGLKDVANSGQVTGGSAQNKVSESDSSGAGKRNESDDSGEDKPMSTPTDLDHEDEMTKQEEIPNKGLVERVKKRLGLEGSNKREGQNNVKRSHVHRESTLPSKQKLFQGNKYRRTNTFPDKQNEATDLDHEEPVKEAEAQSTPRVEAPPAAQALSPLTKSSLNTAPKDPAGGLKDVAYSGQVTGDSAQNKVSESDSSGAGKRNESDDSGEDKPMSTPTDLDHEDEMTKQEEIPNKGLVERLKKRLGLEGSNKREGQNNVKRSHVHRESTLPSKQKLFQGNKYRRTNTFPDKQNEATDLDHKGKDDHQGGDADAVTPKEPPQEKEPLINQSDRVEENDPEPAGVSDHASEDKKSSPESPEHPEPLKEAEAQSTPRVEAPPAAQALSPLTESSLNTAPKDPAEQKDVINSGQVTGDSAQNEVGGSESGEGKRNESEDSTDHKQRGSTASIETDVHLSQGENNTSKESQTVNVKPVSGDEDESTTNAGDHEETDTQQHLNSANSEQTQSPRTKPDHSNTDAGPVSSDTKPAQPDEEEEHETSTDSQDTEGQSDEGEKKIVEDKSKTNAGEHEETDTQQHLNSANSEQTQSPRTKPDHSNTDAGPVSSDTKPAQPDEEEEHETSTDSQDPEGQSDEGEKKIVEDKSKTNAGEHEETDTQQHLNSANSEQTQSPRTKPDHSNTDAGPVSSDTKPAQPDEEEEHETSTDSQDTEGQSDEGEDKTVEDRNEA
uniref:dentin sialophosphoprotein-like isoform X2 n=1 Tax=Gasterosteus aculeatus aculeatus TaxID=481459 RepID=UPI001A994477|nr:dentin sialophosphoprotein-like isoform X2 [Gasterosteus aculeatus aculeatus]